MGDRPNYGPSGYRKAAYRQYIIATYGYLGRGIRRVAPSCVVRCIRRWYPSHDGTVPRILKVDFSFARFLLTKDAE